MNDQKKLTGGAQILAKTGVANYVLSIEKVTPDLLERKDIIQSIQDKCNIINNSESDDFIEDILSFCKTIDKQKTNYINKEGNEKFNQYKSNNSAEKIKKETLKAEKALDKILGVAVTLNTEEQNN